MRLAPAHQQTADAPATGTLGPSTSVSACPTLLAVDVMELARQERTDLADYLSDLDATAWDAPSLCDGWSVRDVAAHIVSYDGLGLRPLAARFIDGRLLPDRINAVGVRANRNRSADEIVALLRQHATPQGLTAGFGGAIGLTDTLIHHQDIRLALDHPRDIPPERLRKALPFAMIAPPIRGAWTARGLKVIAPDVEWSFGRGKAVEGPAQAVLMAVAGRSVTLDDLHGSGLQVLRRRLS